MKQIKIGQQLKVKTLYELCKSGWEDTYLNQETEPCLWHKNCEECFSLEMFQYCGQVVTVKAIIDKNFFTIVEDKGARPFLWHKKMIKKIIKQKVEK